MPGEMTRAGAYRTMSTIRAFEERCLELGAEGLIAGSIHLCLGQEAIPAGAVAALADDDYILTTYRGHGWAIARGVPLERLLGELCQRAGGVNGGRGGSPHFSAPAYGLLGENSIVGAGVPIGAGVAMASAVRRDQRVVVVSIGDGAMNQGSVHEALVFAAARDLPLVLICENNGWAEMTPGASMVRIEDLATRSAAYGIEGAVIDGCDPLAVRAAVDDAAAHARAGRGPVLLECKTIRLSGHYNRDVEHYRPKADREAAVAGDPVAKLRSLLIESGELGEDEVARIDADVADEIGRATYAVRAMDEPDPATAREHLYAPTAAVAETLGPIEGQGELTTYVKAITAALRAELTHRPEVLVYGEDVGFAGGIFGASRGLQEEFGADRVFDTPIAESAMLGAAVGAAMVGMRPVVEIMWVDFMLVALDQVINQAANVRYVSRGELTAPIVIRTQQGVTPGSCAQHSQNLEALLAHVPGLKIGLAATPQDAHDMLRAAIADDDPCVVIEARALYQIKGPLRRDVPVQPVGGARIHRTGDEILIITWGSMLGPVLEAADRLQVGGIAAAVIDLRWLNPLDDEVIASFVRGGHSRVLVAHEANLTAGFGAEVAARIAERHFDWLDAPVARVGVPDSRIPSAPSLQRALVPDARAVERAARMLLGDELAVGSAA